jgi:hypothetical protein
MYYGKVRKEGAEGDRNTNRELKEDGRKRHMQEKGNKYIKKEGKTERKKKLRKKIDIRDRKIGKARISLSLV